MEALSAHAPVLKRLVVMGVSSWEKGLDAPSRALIVFAAHGRLACDGQYVRERMRPQAWPIDGLAGERPRGMGEPSFIKVFQGPRDPSGSLEAPMAQGTFLELPEVC